MHFCSYTAPLHHGSCSSPCFSIKKTTLTLDLTILTRQAVDSASPAVLTLRKVPFTHMLHYTFFPCWMLLVATSCSCAALRAFRSCAALHFFLCWTQQVAAALCRAALLFVELRCFLLVILHKSYHSFTHELPCASKNTIRVFTIWVN